MFLNRSVLVFVLLAVVLANGQSQLEQIKTRISQSGHLNAQSLGPTLAGFLSVSLHTNDISGFNWTYELTTSSLTVTCDAVVWDGRVHAVFYFYLINNDVQMAFTFQNYGTLLQLYAFATNGSPPPQFIKDVSGTGEWTVSFASASPLPVKIAKGVTLDGKATIANGTLLKVLQRLSSHITKLDVSASLFIPVFSANPQNVDLTISYAGNLQLSNGLTLQTLEIKANVPDSYTVDATLQASVKGQALSFHVSGSYVPNKELVLQGDLTSKWNHPLGLDWLTITSATAKLVLADANSQLSLTAQGNVDFISSTVTILFTMSGPNFENILFTIENVKVSKQLQEIYKALTGKPATKTLGQVSLTGTATIAVSTYNTGKFQEGFTIIVDATLVEGTLLNAARVLKKDATPSTFKYESTLYIPIFTQASVTFTLVETGAFPITSRVKCDTYSLEVDLSDESKVVINADLEALTKENTELKFQVTGDFEASSQSVTFTGTLLTPWPQPFGLTWLIINSGKVTLTLGASQEFDLEFTGSASLAFVMTGPVEVDIELGGPELQNALFKVSGIPINPTTVQLICYYLMGMSQPPSEIKSLKPKGTASIAIATFDSSKAKEGFSFEADVSIENSGDLYKVARFFSADPSTVNFQLALYISIFQQSPHIEFTVSEDGKLPMSHGVTVNSYSIDVVIGTSSSISVNAALDVKFKRQPEPLAFQASADWSSDSSSLTLSGTMAGNWVNPFGAKWLVITNLGINLALGPTGITSFSMSGTGNFKFNGNSGDATVSLSVSGALDVTLSAKIDDKWTVYEITKGVLGAEPGALVKDINNHGSVALSFTLDTTTGVTLDLSGQIDGELQNQIKHVSYWWGQDFSQLSFDISLNLPIFSTNPLGVSISLAFAKEIQL